MRSKTEKELDNFFILLLKNDALFLSGQARLILSASKLHKSLWKLDSMSNSRKMKLRERSLQIKKVLEKVADLKLTHYDLLADRRRSSSLQGTLKLDIFANLQSLTLQRVPMHLIDDLTAISASVKKLKVHRSLYALSELKAISTDREDRSLQIEWPMLEMLDLSNNCLSRLDNTIVEFASENMQSLVLSFNQIECCDDFLTHVKVLNVFDASYNQLTLLPIFDKTVCRKLTKLVLCSNRLENVDGISEFFSVEYLDIRDNYIKSHIDLEGLDKLHLLKYVLLKGNPLCAVNKHLTRTMAKLSSRSLQMFPYIDDYQVTQRDLFELKLYSRDSTLNVANAEQMNNGLGRSQSNANERSERERLSSVIQSVSDSVRNCPPRSDNSSPYRTQKYKSRRTIAAIPEHSSISNSCSIGLPPQASTPIDKRQNLAMFSDEIHGSPIRSFCSQRIVESYSGAKNDSISIKRILEHELNLPSDPVAAAKSVKINQDGKSKLAGLLQTPLRTNSQIQSDESAVIENCIDDAVKAISENIRAQSLGSENEGTTMGSSILEASNDSDDGPVRVRATAMLEICSEQIYDLSLVEAESLTSPFCLDGLDKLNLSVCGQELIVEKDLDVVHNIFLDTVEEMTMKKTQIGHLKETFLLNLHCKSKKSVIKVCFLSANEEVSLFIQQISNQLTSLASISKCPKCESTLYCKSELHHKKGQCSNCYVSAKQKSNSEYVLPLKSNTSEKSNGSSKGRVREDSQNSSQTSEPIDILQGAEVVRRRQKKNSSSSVSLNNRTSQLFFPRSFAQDGSDLRALSNKMDGFTDVITNLEHSLGLYLIQSVFDDNEDFHQMAKGYMSSSERPDIIPCVFVITSTKIRFCEVKTTCNDDDLELIKSWFIPTASFPFNAIQLIERGISGQSLTFKFNNSVQSFVFVAFSQEVISTINDVIMSWCLSVSWTRYSNTDSTINNDLKMLDKYVLCKLNRSDDLSPSPMAFNNDAFFQSLSTDQCSTISNPLQGSWICRAVRFKSTLVLLAVRETHLFISAVNFFVVHHSTDAIKSKPFVLIDGRSIKDISRIQRYRGRHNVLTICLLKKTNAAVSPISVSLGSGSTTSSLGFTMYNEKSDEVEWHLKLGNMRQVSAFVKLVQEKWHKTYSASLPDQVVAETPTNLVFFDD